MFEAKLTEAAADRSWAAELVEDIRANANALHESPDSVAREIALRYSLGHVDEMLIASLTREPEPEQEYEDDAVFTFDDSTPEPATREEKPVLKSLREPIVEDLSAVLDFSEAEASEPEGELLAAEEDEGGDILVAADEERTLEAVLGAAEPAEIPPKMVALCALIGAAHHERHAFGNLAPSNIMVGELGQVSVIDPSADPHPEYQAPEGGGATPEGDVYALGCILHEAFGSWGDRATRPIPTAVTKVIARATDARPRNRYPDGLKLLQALQTALNPVESDGTAQVLADAARQAREEASTLRTQALQALRAMQATADETARRESWRELVAADAREADAAAFEQAALFELLAGAAARPDDPAANDALADHLQQTHARLEGAGAPKGELRAIADLIRRYDRATKHNTYLEGKARLSLSTSPPATVDLYRYEPRDRRLWPTPVGALGKTPLDGVRLPMGSYVAILHVENGPDVRYPIHLRRLEHWEGGLDERTTIPLPTRLGDDDIFVPAGPFHCGSPAGEALPPDRVWLDGFVIKRHPVTMGEYLDFLGALRLRSGAELSERCQPQTPEQSTGLWPRVLWSQGRYHLIPDRQGRTWERDWPAVCVPWAGAVAFAEWQAEKEQLPWTLPTELQWEKAGRGVDARPLPWGEHAETLFARYAADGPVKHDAFPADSSPYGVRGLAGNVRDWVRADSPPADGFRVARGGCYASNEGGLALHQRHIVPDGGSPVVSFRLARAVSED